MTSASGRDAQRVIPSGQEDLLAQMLGRGVTLPGNCRFTGGGVKDPFATAEYACGDNTLTLELHERGDAAADALRTDQFAIVVRRGTPPAELLPALVASIHAHESAFEWADLPAIPEMKVEPPNLLLGVFALIVGGLALQYALTRRMTPPPGNSPPDRASTGTTIRLPERRTDRGCARQFRSSRARLLVVRLLGCWPEGSLVSPHQQLTTNNLTTGSRAFGELAGKAPDRAVWSATAVLGAAYLVSRLWFLTRLPAFIDESVHIDWVRDGFGRNILPEILVGKWLPLQVMTLFVLLPVDSLVAVRLASVAMGLVTLLACVRINRELFGAAAGLLAGAIYALLPFALFYDRLALADIYGAAFGAWTVYAAIRAVTSAGALHPLAMTLCLYAAVLSKPTGGVFLAVPLLVCLLLVTPGARRTYLRRTLPGVAGAAALLGLLLAGGYGTGLVVGQSGFDAADEIALLSQNLGTARDWLTTLLTPGVAWAAWAAAAWAGLHLARRQRTEAFLVALFLLVLVPYVLVARKWGPRYVVFTVVPVSLLLGRAIAACAAAAGRLADRYAASMGTLSRAGVAAALLAGVGASALPLDVAISVSPDTAPLPWVDRLAFVTGRSAGYGLPELAEFFRQQAQQGPINIVRFETTGPANEGLNVYLTPSDAILMHTVDHTQPRAADRIVDLARTRRTFFVSHSEQYGAQEIAQAQYIDGATHVWSYTRPGSAGRLDVWELPRRPGR
ncbi:MAG: glycosyltransferase family 39 protein [bacterium]